MKKRILIAAAAALLALPALAVFKEENLTRTLSVLIFLLSGTLAFSIPIRAAEAAPLPEEHNP